MPSQHDARFIADRFRLFDQNGDGRIDADELGVVLSALDRRWTEVRLARLFAALDVDRSGSIEYEEFVNWAFRLRAVKAKDVDDFRAAVRSGDMSSPKFKQRLAAKAAAAACASTAPSRVDRICEQQENRVSMPIPLCSTAPPHIDPISEQQESSKLSPSDKVPVQAVAEKEQQLHAGLWGVSNAVREEAAPPSQPTPTPPEFPAPLISSAASGVPEAELIVQTIAGESCTVTVSTTDRVYKVIAHCARELGWAAEHVQLLSGGALLDPSRQVDDIPGVVAPEYTQDLLAICVPAETTSCSTVTVSGAGSDCVNGTYKKCAPQGQTRYERIDFDGHVWRIKFYKAASRDLWPAAWYFEDEKYLCYYYAVPNQDFSPTEGPQLPTVGWAPWTGKMSAFGDVPAPTIEGSLEEDTE